MALNTHSIAHVSIIDSSGDISKNDLLVHTRSSRFWKGFIGSKNKPCSPASKVGNHDKNIINTLYNINCLQLVLNILLQEMLWLGTIFSGYEYDSTVI